MNLRILTAASRDLVKGKQFYELQEIGLGGYFLDTLYSDIESLILYAGIHRKIRAPTFAKAPTVARCAMVDETADMPRFSLETAHRWTRK